MLSLKFDYEKYNLKNFFFILPRFAYFAGVIILLSLELRAQFLLLFSNIFGNELYIHFESNKIIALIEIILIFYLIFYSLIMFRTISNYKKVLVLDILLFLIYWFKILLDLYNTGESKVFFENTFISIFLIVMVIIRFGFIIIIY